MTKNNHKKLNVAIVGAGRFVENVHLQAYLNSKYSKDINVTGIFNRTNQKAKLLADKYGPLKVYDSYQQLLNDNIDLVSIVTSDHSHYTFAKEAINSGKNVLVEKPFTTKVSEGVDLINSALDKNKLLFVDFHKRFDPFHLNVKTNFKKEIGNLIFGNVWMQNRISVPTGFISKDTASNSSPLWFLGSHMFDLISFITDLQPISVSATSYKTILAKKGIDTLDAIVVSVIYENGSTVNFHLSWVLPNTFPGIVRQGFMLQGNKGITEVNSQERGQNNTTSRAYKTDNPLFLYKDYSNKASGYGIDAIGYFCEQLLNIKNGNLQMPDKDILKNLYKSYLTSTLIGEAVESSLIHGFKVNKSVVIGKPTPIE